MKTKLTALALVAITVLGLTPKPAKAGDKELAVVGGIIGGLIIASAINDHCDTDTRTTVSYSSGDRCDDRGYWDNVSVRVWVPGVWIVERRGFGHSHRRYVDGHYEVRTNRVWVAHDHRHDRRDYRHDYRHDRRDSRRDDRRDRR